MAASLMQEARRLHLAGRLAEAADLYRRVLNAEPAHCEALYGLGMAHAQAGRLTDGERLLAQALAANPKFAEGWRARGTMLAHLGRSDDARLCLDRALALDPGFKEARADLAALLADGTSSADMLKETELALARRPDDADAWNRRGALLVSIGRREDALASFERGVSLDPKNAEMLCNRATLLFEMNRPDEALASFDTLVAIAPELAVGWNNRGNTLMKLERFEEAAESYGRAVAIAPELVEASENRTFALFQLRRTERSPPHYMRGLFDEFAAHYDKTMLGTLDYRAHLHVRDLASRLVPDLRTLDRMLDLGCGTGLAGTALREVAPAARIEGVDISPRMLDAARERGVYDALILGDIEHVLTELKSSYGLAISADTLTYFGELGPIFAGVANRLAPGGLFVFASEAKEGDGWEQTEVHRFRHGESYLRTQAARAALTIAEITPCVLRLEKGKPVAGFAAALRKPGAD